jgi:aminodeoxychorismate synthase component I
MTNISIVKLFNSLELLPYAFIIDKFNENHSIIGFINNDPHNENIIISNSVRDLIKIKVHELKNFISLKSKSLKIGPGWYGYISYDLKNDLFPFIEPKQHQFPLIQMLYFPVVFYLNHRNNTLAALGDNASLVHDYQLYVESIGQSKSDDFYLKLKYIQPFDKYKNKINRIKELIKNGEVYQINFAHRLMFDFYGSPLKCYLAIREKAKPAFGCYFKANDLHILSFSPERFFKVYNDKIQSFPIKGTMPRSNVKRIDKLNRRILRKSEKDHAEHIMIVDLIRNDLGRICKIGSVNVTDLFAIKSYETIHHMVSCISGILNKPYNLEAIIRAVFPGGSITGAPKIAAMKYINELEDFSREIYTGTIGYILSDNSFMDFNIAIRTMLIYQNKAYYAVGGGIVYDSDSYLEYQETIAKSKILQPFMKK